MDKSQFVFDEFELDPAALELRRNGRVVKIGRIPLELLILLVYRRGQVVSRAEIIEKMWGKEAYVQGWVSSAIREIRKALREDPGRPRLVLSTSSQGYVFMGRLDNSTPAADEVRESPAVSKASAEPVQAATSITALPAAGVSMPTSSRRAPPSPATPDRPSPAGSSPVHSSNAPYSPPRSGRSHSGSRGPFGTPGVWIATAGLIALILIGTAVVRSVIHRNRLPAGKVMLAVLPFENISGDPKQEYFSDGMTRDMIAQLGSASPQELGVIGLTSAMQYKQAGKSQAQIAHELGVFYLLRGKVSRSGDNAHIVFALYDSEVNSPAWSHTYDRPLTDVPMTQAEAARAIAAEMPRALPSDPNGPRSDKNRVHIEALDAYMQGLEDGAQGTPVGVAAAVHQLRYAVEMTPEYAQAWAALAQAENAAAISGSLPSAEALPKARDAALRAIELNERLSEAHSALAFALSHLDYDWTRADREFRRAIELNPSDSNAHLLYAGSYLSLWGKHYEAISEMKTAMALDPLSALVQSSLGRSFFYAERYEDAVTQLIKTSKLNPNDALSHERLAHVYLYQKRFDMAIAEEEKARALSGESAQAAAAHSDELRTALASGGEHGYWTKMLEFAQEKQNQPEAYTGSYGMAIIYAQLGQADKAVAALQQAYDEHNVRLTEAAVEPLLSPLHGDADYTEILRRIRVPLPRVEVSKAGAVLASKR